MNKATQQNILNNSSKSMNINITQQNSNSTYNPWACSPGTVTFPHSNIITTGIGGLGGLGGGGGGGSISSSTYKQVYEPIDVKEFTRYEIEKIIGKKNTERFYDVKNKILQFGALREFEEIIEMAKKNKIRDGLKRI